MFEHESMAREFLEIVDEGEGVQHSAHDTRDTHYCTSSESNDLYKHIMVFEGVRCRCLLSRLPFTLCFVMGYKHVRHSPRGYTDRER